MLALTLHHMESRDNVVGIAVKQLLIFIKYIEYAVMSAARQQPAFAVLRDNEALLMNEIIRNYFTVFHTRQPPVPLRIAPPAFDAAEQEQLIIYLQIAFNKAYICQFEYISINADIAFTVVMRLGCRSLQDDLCSVIEF